ncbi:TRAP transporter large permease subunit [Vibrio chagasii]|nr:TRAP transporter large permease subunit [Vibrio chagasii]
MVITRMEPRSSIKTSLHVAEVFFGHFTGGLGIVAIVACMFFASISGVQVQQPLQLLASIHDSVYAEKRLRPKLHHMHYRASSGGKAVSA